MRLLSLLLAATVLESNAFVAVRLLARGRSACLFYHPPALTAAAYASTSRRDPELGWPSPSHLGGTR